MKSFKKLLSAFFCILLVISSVPFMSICSQASDDVFAYAVKYNGNYYKVFDFRLSWEAAEERCEEYGGHLVTLTTSAENEFVYNYITSKRITSAWIGAAYDGDVWHWVTGESYDYNNFKSSGNPSYEGGDEICSISSFSEQSVNYTKFGMYFDEYDDGEWFAYEENTLTGYYICEWESLGTECEYSLKVTDSAADTALIGAEIAWMSKTYTVPENGIVNIVLDAAQASKVSDFFIIVDDDNYIARKISVQSLKKNEINAIKLNFSLEFILNIDSTLNVDYSNLFISGFDLNNLSVQAVKTEFVNTNYKITDRNGNELSDSSLIVTGTVFKLLDGANIDKEVEAVIYGDSDCDGKVNANDALIAELVSCGLLADDDICSAAHKACDVNADGAVDALDAQYLLDVGLFLKTVDQTRN